MEYKREQEYTVPLYNWLGDEGLKGKCIYTAAVKSTLEADMNTVLWVTNQVPIRQQLRHLTVLVSNNLPYVVAPYWLCT